jgi:hypothetical protein
LEMLGQVSARSVAVAYRGLKACSASVECPAREELLPAPRESTAEFLREAFRMFACSDRLRAVLDIHIAFSARLTESGLGSPGK